MDGGVKVHRPDTCFCDWGPHLGQRGPAVAKGAPGLAAPARVHGWLRSLRVFLLALAEHRVCEKFDGSTTTVEGVNHSLRHRCGALVGRTSARCRDRSLLEKRIHLRTCVITSPGSAKTEGKVSSSSRFPSHFPLLRGGKRRGDGVSTQVLKDASLPGATYITGATTFTCTLPP